MLYSYAFKKSYEIKKIGLPSSLPFALTLFSLNILSLPHLFSFSWTSLLGSYNPVKVKIPNFGMFTPFPSWSFRYKYRPYNWVSKRENESVYRILAKLIFFYFFSFDTLLI